MPEGLRGCEISHSYFFTKRWVGKIPTIDIPYIPTPKQRLFHGSTANEVLFGGAAGPGKSCAIVLDALMRTLQYPGSKAYIFRKTYPELEGTVIQEALRWYPKEIATYNVGRHEMILINKSKILFRHCASVTNMYDYQGAEIQWLYIDELTSFEKEIYDYLKTRLRARKSLGLTPIVRCASNPGNIGHGWVKQYFVDAGPYGSMVEHTVKSKAAGKERVFTTQYIPALATDNPYITDDYLFELERKPEALRRALLYGDWDAFEGQVFIEWKNDPEHYTDRKWTHVIAPFQIPVNWPRYMGFDHGYSRPFSVQWWAIGPDGCAYLYKEWYGCKPGQANVGIKLSPREIADGIIERESEDEAKENIVIDRVAGIDTFERSRGDSVAQQMEPVTKTNASGVVVSKLPGVFFRKCDNSRIAGKMQFHERLRFDSEGRPMMQVMNTCKEFIRTFPNLPYDEKNPEDVNSKAEDHGYDAGRMVLMARPCPMRSVEVETIKPFDPFTARRK